MSVLRVCLSSVVFCSASRLALVAAVTASTLTLSACGGGSEKKDLTVDFNYPQPYAYLWQISKIRYSGSGLEGNFPSCKLLSGSFPEGMGLSGLGCDIDAIANEVTATNATIRLTVPGFEGQVDKAFTFVSVGPSAQYAFPSSAAVGATVSYKPINGSIITSAPVWVPAAGQTMVYSLTSGKLPAGLALNAANGEIAGTVGAAAAANNTFVVTVVATSNGRTFTVNSGTKTIDVR
jgi:hypothetical protein